jgi:hypothetical protein
MVRLLLIGSLLPAMLAGCGASVAGSNASGIWFNQPFIGGWDEADTAARHCATFGRTAVYRGRLLTDRGYTTPIAVYDCV